MEPQTLLLLDERLKALRERACASTTMTLAEILSTLSEKGRHIILVLLSIPFCQPISIPGISALLGLLIICIGFRMMCGKGIYLPRFAKKREIPAKTIEKITLSLEKILLKIRRYLRPRLIFFCKKGSMRRANGVIILVLGLFLTLPIPIPVSNVLAGWGVFLLSLGILTSDGLMILLGYIGGVVALSSAALIVWILHAAL